MSGRIFYFRFSACSFDWDLILAEDGGGVRVCLFVVRYVVGGGFLFL